jgi:hypothetical protein
MSVQPDRYVQYSPKDFFYMMVRDPTPPPVAGAGASPWVADGGAQPPPHWMPGIWSAHRQTNAESVELVDVEPGRATWRVRAGAFEPASEASRDLGDDAKRALLAVTAGVDASKHPRGMATDGKIAVPLRAGPESGAVVVGADGKLSIARAADVATVEEHEDVLEVPLLVWNGTAESAESGVVQARAALGTTEDGRAVLARGSFASAAPLAQALIAAGCDRAVVLDRGSRATGTLDRTGTGSPPRARYDESVLYAIATPMRPRAFRFDPATLVAQGSRAK